MDAGDERTRTALLVVLPLLAALITGVAVWGVTGSRIGPAEGERDAALERVAALEDEVASLMERPGDDEPSTESSPGAPDAGPAGSPPAGSGPAGSSGSGDATADGRYFCFVREVVNETGTTYVTVDFAEFLTGAEAVAAATAAGSESPPPNDYFIRNVNPLLRTFPVQAGIGVRLTSTAEGVDPGGYTVILGQWHDFYVGMSPGMERIRDVPYWIQVSSGTVTGIEEQYIP